MDKEETQKIINELNTVRPEILSNKAKKLFEAIMQIADERDVAYLIIDKMAEQLTTPIHSKEWVIEYYRKEVEKEELQRRNNKEI